MPQPKMLRMYLGSVRPVLENAAPVWQDIPADVSEAIEGVVLKIIYPEAETYAHALQLGNLDRLDDRRVHLCYKYMSKMKFLSHPLHHLLPSLLLDAPNYPLRQKTQKCGRVGLVVRALVFHQCGPGSISAPGVMCGLSLLVLYSAMRGFSPGTPVFPSHQKPTFDLICE